MTPAAPFLRCHMTGTRVSTAVARSASKKPVNRDVPLSNPRRTAAPLPGVEQPTSVMRTGPGFSAAMRPTTAPVSSTLPLSTTTRELHAWVRRKSTVLAKVSAIRAASLNAGTTTSRSTVERRNDAAAYPFWVR